MRLAAFFYQDQPQVGLVSDDLQHIQVLDLPLHERQAGALSVIERLAGGESAGAVKQTVAVADVRLQAPIPRPRRNIFCVGKNYYAHAKEFAQSGFDSSAKAGGDIPAVPIIFSKVPECVVGPTDAIVIPQEVSTAIDYEAELAVIIGKGGKGIRKEDALKHVWGYTVVNDVTSRDWQNRHLQWHMGKSFDTFCPLGPCLVTPDEIPDPQRLQVSFRLNGETKQSAPTSSMQFSVADLIAFLAASSTLPAGSVILTGTPAGVGMAQQPPRWLRPGDVMEVEISGIGVLRNEVREET